MRKDFLKSLERDVAGFYPRFTIERSGLSRSNNLAGMAVFSECASKTEDSRFPDLGSDKPIYRTGYWKTPELRFSRHGSRANKNKINNQTKGIVLCHS